MNCRFLQSMLGPRVPDTEPGIRRWRFVIPTVLFVIAASVLVASYTQPYWNMTLYAPQYPRGLHVHAYLNRLEGDVREIDLLNHYIGMRPLGEAAQLERTLSLMLVVTMATLVAAAIVVHTKWVALLAIPAVVFPAGFLIDLHLWLHHFGQNLDPTAPLSNSIKPFTPPVLGEGVIGNFRTVASVDAGWWMALTASMIVIAGLYFHRRAYKPLVDAQRDAPDRSRLRAGVSSQAAAITVLLALVTPSAFAFDLQHAIASADNHAVILVPPGTYHGPILIDRPVTLDGQGKAVLDGRGEGDVVRILPAAAGATVRGFTIRNSGTNLERENTGVKVLAPNVTVENNIIEDVLYGISLSGAANSVVRNNTIGGKDVHIARRGDAIRLWNSHDSLIERNTAAESRDVVMWYSDRVILRGNRVSRSRYGLHFMYSHDNVLEENILTENSVGAFLMYSRNLTVRRNVFARNRGPSGYGIGVKDMQGMVIEDNIIVGNRVGAYLDNPPVYLPQFDRITRNVFAYNDLGIAFQPSVRRVAVFENSFIENHQQVAIWGGGELRGNEFMSPGEDRRGNFWSDYRGFDQTGDGIGDLPYHAESLWDNLMDREPALRLFLFSPAQQAIELAANAFPVVRPRPVFIDEAPLMRPVRADVEFEEKPRSMHTVVLAMTLLATAGLALLSARPQRATQVNGGVQ